MGTKEAKVISGEGKEKIILREMVLGKDNLPLTIFYKDKRYILILTKNDKLILNKYED